MAGDGWQRLIVANSGSNIVVKQLLAAVDSGKQWLVLVKLWLAVVNIILAS